MAAFHIACFETHYNRTTSRKFPAKNAGPCGICHRTIYPGDVMAWNKSPRSAVSPSPSIDTDTDTDTDMPEEIPAPMPTNSDSLATVLGSALIPTIDARIDAKTSSILAKVTNLPQITEIEIKRPNLENLNIGRQHAQFPMLLAMVSTGLNVWVAGPAGSGKTTAAKNVAKALEKSFHYTGAVSDPFALLGFRNALGETVRTAFREAFEGGGVFLFDEIDASDPNALAALHAAIENGVCAFPDGMVDRHADFVLIASANTYGHGGTNDYVGRNKLDGATLDRYVVLDWGYDEDLELATAPNPEWTKKVQRFRANAKRKGLRVLITPRASYQGGALLAAGLAEDMVIKATVRRGLTDEQFNQIN